jgi:hypothetical protein
LRSRVDHNSYGGVWASVSGYEIVNNFIDDNGPSSDLGGVRLAAGSGVFRHNTLFDNSRTGADWSRHVFCEGTSVPLVSSIFWDSTALGSAGVNSSTGCLPSTSVFSAAPSTGTGNLVGMDPLFVNVMTGDLHIQAASPCVGRAPAATAPVDDIDGQLRDGAPDIGADERVP